MSCLIVGEVNAAGLKQSTLKAVTCASLIDEELDMLLVGANTDKALSDAKKIGALRKVYNCANEKVEQHGDLFYKLIHSIVTSNKDITHIVAAAS